MNDWMKRRKALMDQYQTRKAANDAFFRTYGLPTDSRMDTLPDDRGETKEMTTETNIETFLELMKAMLTEGSRKGYDSSLRAELSLVDWISHAKGELLFKVLRWFRKRNSVDLIKIACWAAILYDLTSASEKIRSSETNDILTRGPLPDPRD